MTVRSRISLLLAAAAAFSASGCDTATNFLSAGNSNTPDASDGSNQQLQNPDLDTRTSLGLIRDGTVIRVGDDIDTALQAFPAPQKGSFSVKDLPKRIPTPPYRGAGWSTSSAGFGVVSLNHRVALAMITEVEPDQDHAKTVEDTYQRANAGLSGSTPSAGENRYFFWESGHQRLMIFEQTRPDKQVMMTIALGDKSLMDVIQASSSNAVQDLQSVQTQLQPQIKDTGKAPATKPADSRAQPTATPPLVTPPVAKGTGDNQKPSSTASPVASTGSSTAQDPKKN